MADYQLTATDDNFIRTADGALIPADPANRDYVDYLKWVEDGGVADPYVPPESGPSAPTTEQTVLYEHENRIRALEGQPQLTLSDLLDKMNTHR